MAANVDTVFLSAGLDGDFNPRRVERSLVLAWESGADPGRGPHQGRHLRATWTRRGGPWKRPRTAFPVLVTSARTGDGLSALDAYLLPGRTVALLGSSGTGKSTLVNRLLGYDRQTTLTVREGDDRGRHTTTHRELIPLPSGALVIDTPGLREIQLWAGEGSLGETFSDIAALAETCRYRDCQHNGEPGCGVARSPRRGTDRRGAPRKPPEAREGAPLPRSPRGRRPAAGAEGALEIHSQAGQEASPAGVSGLASWPPSRFGAWTSRSRTRADQTRHGLALGSLLDRPCPARHRRKVQR